jgi:hypothetical protein
MIQLITIGHIIINIMFLMINHGIKAIITTTIIIKIRKTKLMHSNNACFLFILFFI